MSLALTDITSPIARVVTPPITSVGQLIVEFDAVVMSLAGWINRTVYLTGYQYMLVSPQAAQLYCRIWDPENASYPNCVAFQFASVFTPGIVSQVFCYEAFHAATTSDPAFNQHTIWANVCGLFMGQSGQTQTSPAYPRAIMGSIPYYYGSHSEMWWCCGADSGTPGTVNFQTFRSDYWAQCYTFCVDGIVTGRGFIGPTGPRPQENSLQLAILRPTDPLGRPLNPPTFPYYTGLLEYDGTPMRTDPILIVDGVIRGSLWDACLLSGPLPVDEAVKIYVVTSTGSDLSVWHNYSLSRCEPGLQDEGALYSLLLLDGHPIVLGKDSVAY